MRFKATHDPLTTLWNRGVILELLERELVRSHRQQVSTAMPPKRLDVTASRLLDPRKRLRIIFRRRASPSRSGASRHALQNT
jgi:hypothetical protein